MSINWDRRGVHLGKHKHLSADILDEITGEEDVDGDLTTHAAQTQNVHGFADTGELDDTNLGNRIAFAIAAVVGRTIRGQVNANGTIAAGTGFTVNKTGDGAYSITITTPFATVPAVAGAAYPATNGEYFGIDGLPTTSLIKVLIVNSTGSATPVDAVFTFIAMAT